MRKACRFVSASENSCFFQEQLNITDIIGRWVLCFLVGAGVWLRADSAFGSGRRADGQRQFQQLFVA